MERSLALLVVLLAGVAAVWAAAEVPVHMTQGTPLALQATEHHDVGVAEAHRFAQANADAEADAETDAEADAEADSEADAEADADADAEGDDEVESVEVPWKEPSPWQQEVDAADRKASAEEEKELLKPDTVMEESTNTMTQSAKCLMMCANSYGLCTRTNNRGCACAAGCMCNRGEADATCAQHCHPDNQMNFVYGYHDADHFSPHFWGKSIGDVMSDYQQVRACLSGCAKRGKCKPRFCPRHPSGGYKCSACKRLQVVPASRRRGEKRYFTVEQVKRTARVHRTVTVEHSHNHLDEWGHVVRHVHTHTHHSDAFPRFAEQHAEVEADAEAEAEAESGAAAEEGMEVHMEEGQQQVVEADAAMAAAADSEAAMEAQAQAEAEDGYVHVVSTPYAQAVTADASNIQRFAPRVVPQQFVRPIDGEDMADNGPVSAVKPQDPLAAKIDCNFYDCTGVQSEPYVPAGSLNPVEPYTWKRDTRTTTFSTVPDMLEPRAEHKTVFVA